MHWKYSSYLELGNVKLAEEGYFFFIFLFWVCHSKNSAGKKRDQKHVHVVTIFLQ